MTRTTQPAFLFLSFTAYCLLPTAYCSLARAEADAVLDGVYEAAHHRAEVAGVRRQEVEPSVEAGLIGVAAQVAEVFREHEGAVKRRRVLHELQRFDDVHQHLCARVG